MSLQSEIIEEVVRCIVEDVQPYEQPISKAERQVLIQKKTWLPPDRALATRALERIMFGSIEMLGFKRFDLPVEYVAAVIVSCVWPTNWKLAAHMMTDYIGSEAAVQAGFEDAREKCTPDRLFSLVWLCRLNHDRVRDSLEKMMAQAEEFSEDDSPRMRAAQ